jgi:hypothetical protein
MRAGRASGSSQERMQRSIHFPIMTSSVPVRRDVNGSCQRSRCGPPARNCDLRRDAGIPRTPRCAVHFLGESTMRRLILLPLCATLPLHAATYQVGPTRAYHSLNALFAAVTPGADDVVEVDGDVTYPGGVVVPEEAGGSEGHPLVIRGLRVNGHRPIISGSTNTVEFRQSDHLVFEGFEVTGGTSRCILQGAHDVTVRDSVIHGCAGHGILSTDEYSGSFTLEYSEIYDAGSGSTRHPLYIQSDEITHPGSLFRMRSCYVHDGNGGNLLKDRHERSQIHYNWFEGAAYHELELIGPDEETQQPGWSVDLVREDQDVVGNVIVHSNPAFDSVIRVGGDGSGQSKGRARFVNNTILVTSGHDTTVFRIFDGIQAVEAHNNVLYASAGGTIRVERTVEAEWTNGRQVGGSNNWVPTSATFVPAEWTGTLGGTNPGFANVAALDLTPTVAGALHDAGDAAPQPIAGYPVADALFPPHFQPKRALLPVDGAAVRPLDGAIDIGAIEYAGDAIFANGFD